MMSLVWKYLKQQKKRTVLTVLGIVLATALVASLGIFFSSFQRMMLTQSAYDDGTYDVALNGGRTDEEMHKVRNNYLVEQSGMGCTNAFLLQEDAQGAKPQYNLKQYDADAQAFFPKEILEGRRPETSLEVMIPSSMKSLGKVGDTVTLPLYFTSFDEESGQDVEQSGGTVSLTIVGVYEEGHRGNEIITGDLLPVSREMGMLSQYITFKPGQNKNDALNTLLKDTQLGENVSPIMNKYYLMWKGEGGSNGMQRSLNITLLLLSTIILLAMASVIRNSFAMSVSEKMSQFGALRCVGASPKQIRNMVLGEAFLTWVIAVPLGILLGIAAMAVTFSVVQKIDLDALQYFKLVLELWPFLITVLFSLAAVLLSARTPAGSASKISAIEAVRGSTVLRDTSVSGKGGVLLGKLFGFTGSLAGKNIRRDKKRYRTTVFSVTLSIALFISICGFGQKAVQSVTLFSDVDGVDFEFSYTASSDSEESYSNLEKLKNQISVDPGVADLELFETTESNLLVPKDQISQELFDLGETGDHTFTDENDNDLISEKGSKQRVLVYFIGRGTYEKLQLSEGAPTYDELVEQKGVLLNPTAVVSSLETGLTTYPIGTFAVGEKLWLNGPYAAPESLEAQDGSDGAEFQQLAFQLPIAGFVVNTPWFNTQRFTPQIYVPQENRSLFLEQGGLVSVYSSNVYLRVKALPDQKEAVNQRMKDFEDQNYSLQNIYEQEKENRNTATVLNIFVYGFLIVVIVICSLNLFNTIHANLRMRKREIAMLRAVGMDNRMLWRSLLLECVLYGVIGTFWGSIVGFSLQALLSVAISGAIEMELLSSPLLYIGGSLVASVLVCLLAGAGPIRKLIKKPIVEEIRAQE